MRRLGSTVARLSALRRSSAAALGALQREGMGRLTPFARFGANPGKLDAFSYVPADLAPGAPLVVVLHGCTQNAALYDRGSGWSHLADRYGFALLVPQQSRGNNHNLCFNWYAAADARRGRGEAASIAQMVRKMVAAHDLDPARVFINGLSAGGAMTATMIACYPELFAGGAIIAGLPFAVAEGVPDALEAMRGQSLPSRDALARRIAAASDFAGPWPTLSVWHGTADQIVNIANAGAIVDQWRDLTGLGEANATRDSVDGHARTRWRNGDGRVMVERYDIAGMGHGTPIAPRGKAGCGEVAPHFIEAGICSTTRLAERWGLTTSRSARPTAIPVAAENPTYGLPRHVAGVIDDALRAAGLMR